MNEEFCLKHSDTECQECPYYEILYEVNGREFWGKFWAGQNYSVQQGVYGDGVWLRPRQFDYEERIPREVEPRRNPHYDIPHRCPEDCPAL